MAIEIPQPEQRSVLTIAVWEDRPWWTPLLQHRISRREASVRGCRLLQDLRDAAPHVILIDAAADLIAAAHCLIQSRQLTSAGFVILIISRNDRLAEWRLREYGADCVVDDWIGADELSRICRRYLRSVSARAGGLSIAANLSDAHHSMPFHDL